MAATEILRSSQNKSFEDFPEVLRKIWAGDTLGRGIFTLPRILADPWDVRIKEPRRK